MNIYSWEKLVKCELAELYPLYGGRFGVFHSKGIDSIDVKKLILRWIPGANELLLKKNFHGKPYLEGSTWNFNLSHSGDFSAFFIHPLKPVGIDIEVWKSKARLQSVVERYYFKEEMNHLAKIEDIEDWEKEALEMWTIKEALIKRDGGTVFEALKLINTRKLANKPYTLSLQGLFSLGIAIE